MARGRKVIQTTRHFPENVTPCVDCAKLGFKLEPSEELPIGQHLDLAQRLTENLAIFCFVWLRFFSVGPSLFRCACAELPEQSEPERFIILFEKNGTFAGTFVRIGDFRTKTKKMTKDEEELMKSEPVVADDDKTLVDAENIRIQTNQQQKVIV